MSSAESDTPENPSSNSAELGFRSRSSSANSNKPLAASQKVDSTLEQIESELSQIDRIIHSWSDGRSLRFDPAHVKAKRKDSDENGQNERPPEQNSTSLFRTSFFLNVMAVLVVLATVVCEFGLGWIGSQPCIGILAGTSLITACFNLYAIKHFVGVRIS